MTTQAWNTNHERTMRVAKQTLIERMVINEVPFVISTPTLCEPGVTYVVAFDPKARTATINEASA